MTKESPAQFWIDLLTPDKGKSSALLREQELKVLDYLQKHHPAVYCGDAGNVKFAPYHANRMLVNTKRHSGAMDALHRLKFLITGLEAGKEIHDWPNVIVPSPPIKAPREPARFTPNSFRTLNTIQPLYDAFTLSLENPDNGSPSLHLGTILLSGILFGGLLDPKWLTPLLRGLPERIRLVGAVMWVDLQRPYIYPKLKEEPEKRKYLHRRWMSDPLTQALIMRLHQKFPHYLEHCQNLDALFCVKHLIQSIIPERSERLTISEIYHGATTWLGLRLPSFLVSIASGKIATVTLPGHAWTRLMLDNAVPYTYMPDENDKATDLPKRNFSVIQPIYHYAKRQEKLRREMTVLLGDARRSRSTALNVRKNLEMFLESNIDFMAPILQMLCRWAIELLSQLYIVVTGRKGRNPLQPGSVGTYLQAIDKELIACARGENILLFDPDELRGLYDDAIKAAKTKEQQLNCSQKLFLFHHFLIRTYGASVIDMNGLIARKGPPELGVDANVLSPSMFYATLHALGWHLKNKSREHAVCCFLVILGYRCGLRRSEALCLRIGDLMGEIKPEVLVRTSRLIRPKTPDSTRRVPIYLLLEPVELLAIVQWKRTRISEEGSDYLSAPLFGSPGHMNPPDDNETYNRISSVLRLISGDPSIRYHHLRHSCEIRLLLALLANELLFETGHVPASLRDMMLPPHRLTQLKNEYFGNMNQGRQFLYGVSALLGHADPSTSMLHYFHLGDWFLGQMVKHPSVQPDLTVAALMQITGLKRAMVFRTKAEASQSCGVMSSFIDRLARHSHDQFPDPLAKSAVAVTLLQPEEIPPASLPDWHIIIHAFKLIHEKNVSIQAVAESLGVSVVTINAWLKSADAIKNVTTENGVPRHLTGWQRMSLNTDKLRPCFPERPDYPPDIKIVDLMFRNVARLKGDDLNAVTNGVNLFISRFNGCQNFLRFSVRNEALAFKLALKLTGIPDYMVFVTMFPDTGPNRNHDKDFQRAFLKELRIDLKQCTSTGRYHVRSKKECSIAFVIAASGKPVKRREKTVDHVFSYGFRFAIYLLAIGLQMTEFP